MMCLSKSQDGELMKMCLSKSQDDDISMTMCLSKSQDDDIMMMCLSKSQDDDISMMMCLSKSQDDSRVPLLPICWTISISNISTNISTGIYGVRFCRNVRNGDCPTNGEEWHTPGFITFSPNIAPCSKDSSDQTPKSPITDLSFMRPNGVSCSYAHL